MLFFCIFEMMQNFEPIKESPQNTISNRQWEQPNADFTLNAAGPSNSLRNEYLDQSLNLNKQFQPQTSMLASLEPQNKRADTNVGFNPFEFSPLQNYRPPQRQMRPSPASWDVSREPQFSPRYSQQFYPQQNQFRPQMANLYNQFDQRYPQQFEENHLPDYTERSDQNFIPNDLADRPAAQRTNNPERLVRLKLENRTGQHSTADAMVYLPPGFDPSQKYDLVVFNHGHRSSAESSMREFNLAAQMKKGHPQTVLIVPEWQVQAAASNGVQGRFAQEGFFTNMLKEILQKTPELAQGGLNNVERMHIFSHSAGYTPTGSILNKNPELASRINSVTMLDSLYADTVTPWVQANLQAIANGEKRYTNIYNSSTANNSINQLSRLKQSLARIGRPDAIKTANNIQDFGDNRTGIIFRRTNTSHGLIPNNYISSSMDNIDT